MRELSIIKLQIARQQPWLVRARSDAELTVKVAYLGCLLQDPYWSIGGHAAAITFGARREQVTTATHKQSEREAATLVMSREGSERDVASLLGRPLSFRPSDRL